jgi:3-oxoacyl-[acyl-carrier protein] reductase
MPGKGGRVKLDGKVAVVTGGGSGIGEAICVAFAEEGAQVAVLDVNRTAAELTAGLLPKGHAVVADVSDRAAVDQAFADVEAALGPVDILVNNAGIGLSQAYVDRLAPRMEQQLAEAAQGAISTPLDVTVEISDDEWRQMLAIHLDGTFFCTRAALRSMTPRRTGAVVNIASICGMEGCTGAPHYSAAKAGILGFTRAVGKEVILQGVRVNAIAPGYVDTPMVGQLPDFARASTVLQTPIGRLGRPAEIAALAVFLASDDASFFVGATVSPNGGYVTV